MNQRHLGLYMSLVELIKEILLRKQYFRQKIFDNGHIIKQHTKFTINIKKKQKKQEINTLRSAHAASKLETRFRIYRIASKIHALIF